jgi:hypothetical protein
MTRLSQCALRTAHRRGPAAPYRAPLGSWMAPGTPPARGRVHLPGTARPRPACAASGARYPSASIATGRLVRLGGLADAIGVSGHDRTRSAVLAVP